MLRRGGPALHARGFDVPVCDADPYGLDVQLSLYVCYELHYRGFAGVNAQWEWSPALLHVRGRLEEAFLSAVRRDIGPDVTASSEMDALSVEPIDGGARPTTYGTAAAGRRCGSISCIARCITSRRAIRTPGRFPG